MFETEKIYLLPLYRPSIDLGAIHFTRKVADVADVISGGVGT